VKLVFWGDERLIAAGIVRRSFFAFLSLIGGGRGWHRTDQI
jgi:hypothetical protein